MLNEVKDLTDRLSDFGSCTSELSESSGSSTGGDESGEENLENGGFKTMNEKKRIKKLKITPGKEQFLKKPNLVEEN